MMFYEFSEHELLMAKPLSNIQNVQLDYLTGIKKTGISFVSLSN